MPQEEMMSLPAWFFFILTLVFISILGSYFDLNPKVTELNVCRHELITHVNSSPILCGEKIVLKNARVHDFQAIKGISLKKARALYLHVEQNPLATIEDLIVVTGIGPKTISNLKIRFKD